MHGVSSTIEIFRLEREMRVVMKTRVGYLEWFYAGLLPGAKVRLDAGDVKDSCGLFVRFMAEWLEYLIFGPE